MACAEGEEEHLLGLGAGLDARVSQLRGSFGEIGDLRLMVMAALMVADELDEAKGKLAAANTEIAELQEREAQAAGGARAGDARLTEHLLGVSESSSASPPSSKAAAADENARLAAMERPGLSAISRVGGLRGSTGITYSPGPYASLRELFLPRPVGWGIRRPPTL